MDFNAESAGESTLEITVLRCTCGHPDRHAGQPCPRARSEPRGVVAFHSPNPARRLAWRLTQLWRDITHG